MKRIQVMQQNVIKFEWSRKNTNVARKNIVASLKAKCITTLEFHSIFHFLPLFLFLL